MQERRKAIRNRSLLGAIINFNKRSSSLDGVVRNFSSDGAKIVFPNTVNVPNEFDLQIAWKERTYRAHMMWRSASEVGVSFAVPETQPTVIPLDLARRLKECETAKAALRRRVEQLDTPG